MKAISPRRANQGLSETRNRNPIVNIDRLNRLEAEICSGNHREASACFQGADLILSEQPISSPRPGHLVIISGDALILSWIVLEIKEVFTEEIDYRNKLEFYPGLGATARRAVGEGLNLSCVL